MEKHPKHPVSLNSVSKNFDGHQVLGNFSLEVKKGAVVGIFGPNGSGKTTLLRMVAGLETPDHGNVYLDEEHRNALGYLFQDYRSSLFPWFDTYTNIALTLSSMEASQQEALERIREVQAYFDVAIDPKKYPHELSGGQQQILAFVRALVRHPKLILIDEAFSALDHTNRDKLLFGLQKYYLQHRPTILFISHSINELVLLADEVLIMGDTPTRISNALAYPRSHDSLTSVEGTEFIRQLLCAWENTTG